MSEFSDDMRDASRDIARFRTAQSTERLKQLAEEQAIQSAHQTALLGDILFEQQIAGLSEGEKQMARESRREEARAAAEQLEREIQEQERKETARNRSIMLGLVLLMMPIGRWVLSENDKKEQAETLRRAAEQGREEAARRAAEAERRTAEAREEEAKAAPAKAAKAQLDAAKVALDAAQASAVRLHLQRANNGSSGSQLEVGRRYLTGNGLPQDKALAVYWLKAAAAQGEKAAEVELRKLAP